MDADALRELCDQAQLVEGRRVDRLVRVVDEERREEDGEAKDLGVVTLSGGDRLQALRVEEKEVVRRIGRPRFLRVRRPPQPDALGAGLDGRTDAEAAILGRSELVEEVALASAVDAGDGADTNGASELSEVRFRLLADDEPLAGGVDGDERHGTSHHLQTRARAGSAAGLAPGACASARPLRPSRCWARPSQPRYATPTASEWRQRAAGRAAVAWHREEVVHDP